jgi:NADPH:quinone reductase-like Zn-dependent oxidoreductase
MKAVVLKEYGGVDRLLYEDLEAPAPGVGEVLVKIAATSVNPIDWKLRSGAMREFFPLQLPTILGRDLAGEVAGLGSGVSGFTSGQRVMALASRAYAEFAVVKATELAPIPEGLDFEQAAALPLVVLTGAQLIERGLRLKAGQSVLLTGAVGSVGRSAAYVAAQHGLQVIAVVRASQLSEGESLGTLGLVALDNEAGLNAFKDIDAVADTVGGTVAVRMLKQLHPGGIFASVVGLPKEAEEFDVRTERVVVQPDASRLSELAQDVAKGRFHIPIARVFKLSEIRLAHQLAEAGGVGGKIVLIP